MSGFKKITCYIMPMRREKENPILTDHELPSWEIVNFISQTLDTPAQSAEILGTTSSIIAGVAISGAFLERRSDQPHLIIVPDEVSAENLISDLAVLCPQIICHFLPGFDVSPYSGIIPQTRIQAKRIGWLYQAHLGLNTKSIFIATSTSFAQKTLPRHQLANNCRTFSVDDELYDEERAFTSWLSEIGYVTSPVVEEIGQFAIRGGIIDIFSPAHNQPIRIELFADTIESLRHFDPTTQRTTGTIESCSIIPCREILLLTDNRELQIQALKKSCEVRGVPITEYQGVLHALVHGRYLPEMAFSGSILLPEQNLPIEFFATKPRIWFLDESGIERSFIDFRAQLEKEKAEASQLIFWPEVESLYTELNVNKLRSEYSFISFKKSQTSITTTIPYFEFFAGPILTQQSAQAQQQINAARILNWKLDGYCIVVCVATQSQAQRLKALLENEELTCHIHETHDFNLHSLIEHQRTDSNSIDIAIAMLSENLIIKNEKFLLLREEDFFGQKRHRRGRSKASLSNQQLSSLTFGDLKVGDYVAHTEHGIGVYEGLKVMSIHDATSEFLQLQYRDGDKLYLPVYRISQLQKYSSPLPTKQLDKLGGQQWEKAKVKVKHHLRDIAAELIALYAKRAQTHRSALAIEHEDYLKFEAAFPYDETDDQIHAIQDIVGDYRKTHPMDRLICGDVGFGKTEVAMRAAFMSVQNGYQVALLAPTTVLTFQHMATLEKRFKDTGINIAVLNRFVPSKKAQSITDSLAQGKIDILIGTHRILSNDIQFKNLGLLIIDEEQKFGVRHKEKIKKLKINVDCLTLSATPIPRTLNISLLGIRDISMIRTPPVDRLPTKTYVLKYDTEVVKKAINAELQRGGQIYFVHNRVQTIDLIASDIRQMLPNVRIQVAHGQMSEHQLEKVMIDFFNRQIDVLICTTIIESGVDNPFANTMIVHDAHIFGLSQLYQLRGRIGRSKEKAYCYLTIPKNKPIDEIAEERLRILQEHTELGSGLQIAQYDLELRGTGNILGENQSGHISAVGYELYLDLLETEVQQMQNADYRAPSVEPEINVPIAALIPDNYIEDVRLRLAYYKQMSTITTPEDLDSIEENLRDQFGKPPEAVLNLMTVMLIRYICKILFITNLSATKTSVSLTFSELTPISIDKLVKLSIINNKKYKLSPGNRLAIKPKTLDLHGIYDELISIQRNCMN